MNETNARSRELGHHVRTRRDLVGLTGTEVAERLGWTPSTLSRLETGQRGMSEADVVQCLTMLGFPYSDIQTLRALCRESIRDLGHWLARPESRQFHESQAASIFCYNLDEVPTSPGTDDEGELPDGPHRTCLLHQQTIDGSDYEQLLKLLFVSNMDNVDLFIVPAEQRYGSPFQLIEYDQHSPLVYLPSQYCGVFIEVQSVVFEYVALVERLLDVALDTEYSRELILHHADRARTCHGGSQRANTRTAPPMR